MIKILFFFFLLTSVHSYFHLCQQCRRSVGGNETTNEGDGGAIGCTITRDNCNFNESSENGEPEPPTEQEDILNPFMPFIKSTTDDGVGVVLELNVTFSPPQNTLITWVDGFQLMLHKNQKSFRPINICLGRQLSYNDDAARQLDFACFTEFIDEVILPESQDYSVTVQTIYREQLSEPITYDIPPLYCSRITQLQNSSLCEAVREKRAAKKAKLSAVADVELPTTTSFPIAVVLVALFLVFILVLIGAIFYKRPKFFVKMLKTHQSFPPDVQQHISKEHTSAATEEDEPITEKPVLIYVCDPEQEEVKTFVVYLINFLRRDLCVDAECNLFDEEAEVNYSRWLENKLKEDKKVLVIWSPLSRERWERQHSYDPFLPLLYQMKSQMILNPKYTQLASATFKCLQGDQCVPEVFRNYTPIFYLPENIELLYFWLQGKEMFLPGQEMIITPLNDDNYKHTQYGPSLKASYDALVKQSGPIMEWYDGQITSLSDDKSIASEKGDVDSTRFVSPGDSKPSMSTYYGEGSSYQSQSEAAHGDGKSTMSTYYGEEEEASFHNQQSKAVACTYDEANTGMSTYYGEESTYHSRPEVKGNTNNPPMSTYYGEESSFHNHPKEVGGGISKDSGTYYASESSSDDDDDVGPCTEDGICAHCTKIRMLEQRAMESFSDGIDSIRFATHHKSDISIVVVVDSSDDEESLSVQAFDFNENDALC